MAALPSLHAGVTLLFVLFIWRRSKPWGRILGLAYVLAMAFALVYSAEHYALDIFVGWLLAGVVTAGFAGVEQVRAGSVRRGESTQLDEVDTLTRPKPTASRMENQCPPIETTPLSA